ncbi:SLC13/DASS family transporter [Exilibacterium tricleocarpae]|uniref:SLC13/DASS family transporter n=2 Tax=Exilibacterium tricleocarpae TaxID=2591008 RepID=A0A545STP6_9GAMM|nr:SLC13/DASS family transporter [Exilibacterium tricleocarpae]
MDQYGWQREACLAGGMTLWCAVWWMLEPVPIPATAMIPLGLFPLLGVLDGEQIAQAYGNPLILLLMAGAILSKAMEKSGAHRRLAIGMVNLFGGSNSRNLVMGFMGAAAVLSMWISNTATTLMLLPVALAVLEKTRDQRLAVPLLLGIAYAASIGGLGTPIGTPPNVIMMNVYTENTGVEIGFMQWMGWAMPVVILLLPAAALWLTRGLGDCEPIELPVVGRWQPAERRVLVVFALTALAWMTLREPFGGWTAWLGLPQANYAAVAMAAALVLFAAPDGRGGRLLDWETASTIHWGVLLLFAGGIAIAKAFVATGISQSLGEALGGLTTLPLLLVILTICLGVMFLTEITSNTATTTLLMPILAAAALGAGMEPVLLMVPAALSASCAFMLPVATAPNAIVFSSGRFAVKRMAREGLGLNFIAAGLVALICWQVVG